MHFSSLICFFPQLKDFQLKVDNMKLFIDNLALQKFVNCLRFKYYSNQSLRYIYGLLLSYAISMDFFRLNLRFRWADWVVPEFTKSNSWNHADLLLLKQRRGYIEVGPFLLKIWWTWWSWQVFWCENLEAEKSPSQVLDLYIGKNSLATWALLSLYIQQWPF